MMWAAEKAYGEPESRWPRWMKSIGQPIVRTFFPWNLTFHYVVLPQAKHAVHCEKPVSEINSQ